MIARLRDGGKIVAVGLPNADRGQLRQPLTTAPVAVVENRCNLLERDDLTSGLVDSCAERGTAYVACWSADTTAMSGWAASVHCAKSPHPTAVAPMTSRWRGCSRTASKYPPAKPGDTYWFPS